MEMNRKDFSLRIFFLLPIFASTFSCVEGAFNVAEDLARTGAGGSDALRSGPEQSLALAKHPEHESQIANRPLVPSHMIGGPFPLNNLQPPSGIGNSAALQDDLAQTVQKLSEALENTHRPGSTSKTPGHNFRVDPTYSDEKPIQQLTNEQKKKAWIKAHKKARLPPLHSEKYDWHVVRWTKALGRGTKKVLGYFFRGLWKVISFPFRTIIKDPREEVDLATGIQKPKEAIESALDKDKASKAPTQFPFIKEDDMMHRARLVGQQVQSKGVEAIRTAMRENRHDQQDSVISELRELPSYLEAQKNLFQAHQILLHNQHELDPLVQRVSNVYQDEAKMQDSMEEIFGKYVEYFRHTEGLKDESLKYATPRDILDHYIPWIQHIPIGSLDLLVKEPNFLEKVLKSNILGKNEEESTVIWNKLKTHAKGVRQLYGKPAEELTRWQNVISQYESKLQQLSGGEKEQLSTLVPQFDSLTYNLSLNTSVNRTPHIYIHNISLLFPCHTMQFDSQSSFMTTKANLLP
ncbi:uncharacterized protein MELLADRAFT_106108 [Melampsora larici-populina 98AG31]|uniref:Secreted protein n=1 Tax=Melampsora larici-populina (strain 98AG31 / pathotype 3-4-7) TaxID=747676 RepID=F4RKE8_MELLP|nr:uncharacterized protein MELLADRAFT_106108 [Melampsora larici-populina 98AG31]EGG07195.1 hypothetical protein MELLADRAFT_106108 [Melampsora larici-populina 98AG31]